MGEMGEMVVLVPSRGRPGNIRRLWAAWKDTGAAADLLVLVDDDDPTLEEYLEAGLPMVISGKRRRIGPLLNDWAVGLAADYDVIGFMGDDHVPRTPGWDQSVLEASTPWSVVYGDDRWQGERLPTAVFLGAGLVRELGWFAVPGCQHLYLDNGWRFVGTELGTLRYLPEVVIEHMHPLFGKAETDALYAEVNDRGMYVRDRAAFARWIDTRSVDDLGRVRVAMGRG